MVYGRGGFIKWVAGEKVWRGEARAGEIGGMVRKASEKRGREVKVFKC